MIVFTNPSPFIPLPFIRGEERDFREGAKPPLLLTFPLVVVKGKCQGLMFSDFVSLTPFKQLEQLFPRLRHAFAMWGSSSHP